MLTVHIDRKISLARFRSRYSGPHGADRDRMSFVPTGGVSLLTLVSRGRAPISLAGPSSTLAQWLALCPPKAPVHGVATLPLSLGCSATGD